MTIVIRHAEPEDYDPIIAELDNWWGGRSMADMLPRLFFTHFRPTSFVATDGEGIAGFVTGFLSATNPEQAYIHFAGVAPRVRGHGVGRLLYERFFEAATKLGASEVLAVTSPVNTASIAFHRQMDFVPLPGDGDLNGNPYTRNYDGPGEDRVRFRRKLR